MPTFPTTLIIDGLAGLRSNRRMGWWFTEVQKLERNLLLTEIVASAEVGANHQGMSTERLMHDLDWIASEKREKNVLSQGATTKLILHTCLSS